MDSFTTAEIESRPVAYEYTHASGNADMELGEIDDTMAGIVAILRRLGMGRRPDGIWCMPITLRAEMETMKNDIRKEAHRQRASKSIEAYRHAVWDFANQRSIDTLLGHISGAVAGNGETALLESMALPSASSEPPMETPEEARNKLSVIQDLSQTLCRHASSHSFVAGLIQTLKTQLDHPKHCLRWVVHDAVFVEHECVGDFTRGALRLMLVALGFNTDLTVEAVTKEAGHVHPNGDQKVAPLHDRAFTVGAAMSNARIRTALARLPRERSLVAGCHGSIIPTAICRSNVDGTLDGDYCKWRSTCHVL